MIFASLFALMSTGLTFTYITTRVPNFAHGNFVTVGAYLAYTFYRFTGLDPYVAAIPSFLLCGAIAVSIYRFVLKPLADKKSSTITQMIATLAVNIIFIGIFGIYSDYLSNVMRFFDARYFSLISADITIFGQNGVLYTAPLILAACILGIYVLFRTRFGIAMRAAVENPRLANTLGINVEVVHLVAWFIGGGLAGLAGAIVSLWLPGNPNFGTDFIIGIFAASILGGLNSIYGAVIGGVLIGGGEVLGTLGASNVLGSWVLAYQQAVPMTIMAVTLLLMPRGITSINWSAIKNHLGVST